MYCINANYVSGNDMEKSKERKGNESLGFGSEAGAIMDPWGRGRRCGSKQVGMQMMQLK